MQKYLRQKYLVPGRGLHAGRAQDAGPSGNDAVSCSGGPEGPSIHACRRPILRLASTRQSSWGMVLAAWLSLLLVSAATMARAQQPADAAALDAELATFRDGLFRAFNEGDYQRMLDEFCHKDVIATWQDGTTSQGHAGVIAEFDKLKQFIDQMKVNPTTDQRLVLNEGRLVVSSGDMQDDYALRRGHNVSLRSRWSATLVKENDRWWLISFSASTNAFDNEVINLYLMNMKYKTAALAGFIGLAVGIVTTIVLGKRRK